MKRLLLLLTFLPLFSWGAERPGRALAALLDDCLTCEELVPDSIYGDIRRLEGICHQHPVYTAALARLYAERASLAQVYQRETPSAPDKLKEWSRVEWNERARTLFREALADQQLLHGESTKSWLPVVTRGHQEKIFGGDMLYVVWQAMQWSLPQQYWREDSVLSLQRLIDFYEKQGMKDAVRWLTWERDDSVSRLTPRLSVDVAATVYPGKAIPVVLWFRNMKNATLRVMRGKKTVQRLRLTLPACPPTESRSDTLQLNSLPAGEYRLRLEGTPAVRLAERPKRTEITFNVSPQKVFSMGLPGGKVRLWKVDAMSGAPMDTLLVDTANFYHYFQYIPPSMEVRRRLSLFTDRPIYRPGQTVHLGGVAYTQRHWDAEVLPALNMPVVLRDARNNAIDTVWVVTDTLGVFACDFSLPKEGRTGRFAIEAGGESVTFAVEEYRRPTFWISLEADSVSVRGVATGYNGVPVRGARVTASLSRWGCLWRKGVQPLQRLDTVYTDAEGRFSYVLPAEAVAKGDGFFPRLRVNVEVQSAAGEVQDASAFVRLFPDPPQPEVRNPWHCAISDTLYVFETMLAGDKVLRDTMWLAVDSLCLPQIPYEKRFGDGALVVWSYVKDGMLHRTQSSVKRPLPADTLQYRWDTFRDHVRPGGRERWSLTLTRKDGTPVSANLMLSLYDASLDALASQSWSLRVPRYHQMPWTSHNEWNDFSPYARRLRYNMVHWAQSEKALDFSRFNDLYFQLRYLDRRHYRHNNVMLREVKVSARKKGSEPMLYASLDAAPLNGRIGGLSAEARAAVAMGPDDAATSEEEENLDEKPLRADFSETSFFYPSLRSDASGRISIVFDLPESLTTWHLRGLAHTRTLESVAWDDTVVAQKPLMAELRVPRFLRRGDEVTVAATVSNISEERQTGRAVMQYLEPSSGRILHQERVSFSLSPSSDTIFSFRIKAPEGSEVICRWQAETPEASDGEQRSLPVLSDVEHVTVSRALTCTPEELERLSFDDLFPEGATNKQLRKVVTDPVTSAREALPHLTLPRHNDVLSLLAGYYAQTLLEAMHSPLAVPYGREFCISRLSRFQTDDGFFCWFSGMRPNRWITREVVRTLRRLNRLMKLNGEDESSPLFTLHASLLKKAEKVVGKELDAEHVEDVADAPRLKRRLTHPDGYYLSFPGGFSYSVDERLSRHVDALELMQEVYPEDTLIHRGIRRWILDQRRTEGWQNPLLTVNAVYALLSDKAVAGREQWVGVFADFDLPMEQVRDASTGISVGLSLSVPGIERITLTADRNYEYVHLVVPRASLSEPEVQTSGYGWNDGFSFYREIHDDRTEYFIEQLPQGTFVLEERQRLERHGRAATGVTRVECLYAPEFRAHTASQTIKNE